MARIRTVKPEFYRHELLQELETKHPKLRPMLVFSGLWTLSDKEGRFQWKPRTIKLDLLPFINFDMGDALNLLEANGFIRSYIVDNERYGLVLTFPKHQRITGKEFESGPRCPAPNDGETSGKHPDAQEREGKGKGKGKDTCPTESPSDVDIRLVQLLVDLMLKNNPESSIIKRLTTARQSDWIRACRLLREADGKTPAQIEQVIAFSQADEFWKSNILSMPKLREKWDQLWLKAKGSDPHAGIKEWLADKEKENDGK